MLYLSILFPVVFQSKARWSSWYDSRLGCERSRVQISDEPSKNSGTDLGRIASLLAQSRLTGVNFFPGSGGTFFFCSLYGGSASNTPINLGMRTTTRTTDKIDGPATCHSLFKCPNVNTERGLLGGGGCIELSCIFYRTFYERQLPTVDAVRSSKLAGGRRTGAGLHTLSRRRGGGKGGAVCRLGLCAGKCYTSLVITMWSKTLP